MPVDDGETRERLFARFGFLQTLENIMLGTILLILLVLLVIGALPRWPHSRKWGYYPSGGLGLLVVILIVLVFTNRI